MPLHPTTNYTTPHHTTPNYTTPHHTTPHHTTPHHTTPLHPTQHHPTPHNTIKPNHTTLHHTTPHHTAPPLPSSLLPTQPIPTPPHPSPPCYFQEGHAHMAFVSRHPEIARQAVQDRNEFPAGRSRCIGVVSRVESEPSQAGSEPELHSAASCPHTSVILDCSLLPPQSLPLPLPLPIPLPIPLLILLPIPRPIPRPSLCRHRPPPLPTDHSRRHHRGNIDRRDIRRVRHHRCTAENRRLC